MRLKTTVRHSHSVKTINALGLEEWKSWELIEEHDAEADREEIKKDIEATVQRWHKEAAPSAYFQSTELPVIQEKDR